MSVEAFLDSLGSEATAGIRAFLKQAYERGYREALTHSGQSGVSPLPPSEVSGVVQRVDPTPPIGLPQRLMEPPRGKCVDWNDGDDDNTDEGSPSAGAMDTTDGDPSESSSDSNQAGSQPIMPHATIGTLRQRILRTFVLDRFNIEVVICRTGDPNRRQLKSSVRLNKYLIEG
jgi:hypothetical protein